MEVPLAVALAFSSSNVVSDPRTDDVHVPVAVVDGAHIPIAADHSTHLTRMTSVGAEAELAANSVSVDDEPSSSPSLLFFSSLLVKLLFHTRNQSNDPLIGSQAVTIRGLCFSIASS